MRSFPSTPPSAAKPSPWNFPDTVVRQIANGIQVVVIRMPALPIVSVRWCFVSGRLHEKSDCVGSGFLLQCMLRHGTEDLSSADFARHLDRRGIRLGTQVSVDSTVISVSALREYLGEALSIANDVAFRPSLPAQALALERIRAIQAHQQAMGQVENMANVSLSRSMYGAHPYGIPTTTRSGLQSTGREEVRALHQQICDPSRALLLVVGDVHPDEVVDVIARKVSAVSSDTRSTELIAPQAPTSCSDVVLIERPGAEQVVVGVGTLAMARNHPEFLPLRVVNHVWGGGASSRLFAQLRERQGLTYGAYSQLDCGRWAGDLTASMTVAPQKLSHAVGSLAKEIDRIGTGEITSSELKDSIHYLVGSFPQRASGLAGVSSLTMAAWLHDLPSSTWRDYQAALQAITPDVVESTARSWIKPDRFSWIIAGSPEALDEASGEISALQRPIRRMNMESMVD